MTPTQDFLCIVVVADLPICLVLCRRRHDTTEEGRSERQGEERRFSTDSEFRVTVPLLVGVYSSLMGVLQVEDV